MLILNPKKLTMTITRNYKVYKHICSECGNGFESSRQSSNLCSNKCRAVYRTRINGKAKKVVETLGNPNPTLFPTEIKSTDSNLAFNLIKDENNRLRLILNEKESEIKKLTNELSDFRIEQKVNERLESQSLNGAESGGFSLGSVIPMLLQNENVQEFLGNILKPKERTETLTPQAQQINAMLSLNTDDEKNKIIRIVQALSMNPNKINELFNIIFTSNQTSV